MRCRACGNRLRPTDDYCPQCGAQVAGRQMADPQAGKLGDGVGEPGDMSERHFPRRRPALATDEEQTLWQGTFSWKAMIRETCVAAGLSVGLLLASFNAAEPGTSTLALQTLGLLWLLWLGLLMFRKLDVSYTLTNQRLIHRRGILYRRTSRIEAIDIDDLTYEQGLLERLLNVGRIRVDSSDVTNRELLLEGIDRPRDVCELIEQARRNERRKYGLHIEAV